MSLAQRTDAEPTLTAPQLLLEVQRLWIVLGAAPPADRPGIEAQIRAYADRYRALTDPPAAPVPARVPKFWLV